MLEEARHFACRYCAADAWICRHCDRGHAYCSLSCRKLAGIARSREARRRYQATSAGQSGNARRQREWYQRQSEKLAGILTHHGSTDPAMHTIIPPAAPVAVLAESANAASREIADFTRSDSTPPAIDLSSGVHRCSVCQCLVM
jgi:hypothetical protein